MAVSKQIADLRHPSRLFWENARKGKVYESIINTARTYIVVRVRKDNTVDVVSAEDQRPMKERHTYKKVACSVFYADPIEG